MSTSCPNCGRSLTPRTGAADGGRMSCDARAVAVRQRGTRSPCRYCGVAVK